MSTFSRVRVIGTVAALVLAACGGDDGASTETAGGGVTGGKIVLEPVDGEMPDPFLEDNLDLVSDTGPMVDQLGESISGGLIEVPGESISGGLIDVGVSGQQAQGSEPGLYGGSMDEGVCDVDQLLAFLTDPANAEVAQAWADVQGISVDEMQGFVEGLTPVRLVADTRVTNHGYENGEPTPFQSVLQAGTAVLVDNQGVPRAKCFCGNPLAPPEPVVDEPSDGEELDVEQLVENPEDAWEGFDSAKVMAVETGDEVDVFQLVNFETGERFARPVGTNGTEDEVVPPGQSGGSDPGQAGGGGSAECRVEEYPDGSRREICDGGGSSSEGSEGPTDKLAQCYAEAEAGGVDPAEFCGPTAPPSDSESSGSAGACPMPDPSSLNGEVRSIQQREGEIVIEYSDGRVETRAC